MRQYQQEYLLACNTSATIAAGFSRPTDLPTPDQFIFTRRPGDSKPRPVSSSKRMTADEIFAAFRNAALRTT